MVMTLYAVKTDYAEKRTEESMVKSVSAVRISQSVIGLTHRYPPLVSLDPML